MTIEIKARPWRGFIRNNEFNFLLQSDIGKEKDVSKVVEIADELKSEANKISHIGTIFDPVVKHSRAGIVTVSIRVLIGFVNEAPPDLISDHKKYYKILNAWSHK